MNSHHGDPTVYIQAHTLHAHGIRVIPVRADGSKAPALKAWQQHQTTEQDIEQWFGGLQPRHTALGIVCGPDSGNLEMAEIEGAYADKIVQLAELAQDTGLTQLWDKLTQGWVEQSPSGGIHWFYRVAGMDVPGNTKLANGAPYTDEHGKRVIPTIAETRGRGGQTVAAPTGGHAHPTGRPWARLAGSPATMATLTPVEREQFHALLGTLDEREQAEAAADNTSQDTPRQGFTGLLGGLERQHASRYANDTGTTPGDDFENKTSWADILEPAGWTLVFSRGRTNYWRRPGKTDGFSATTGRAEDRDRLYVFSSSTEFPTFEPITKFGAYAILNHQGNHSEAARDLRGDGYGEPAKAKDINGHAAAAALGGTTEPTAGGQPESTPAGQPFKYITDTMALTDDWNGVAFTNAHAPRVRYHADRDRWLVWAGHKWELQPKTGGKVKELAKQTSRSMLDLDLAGEDPKKVMKHITYSLSDRGITAMLAMARTNPTITVSTDDLDAHALELNTPGGIVDLRTGQISPPDPAKLHTRSTTVTPDPTANSSLWDQFLQQTFPDPEIRDYMQLLVGHSLLGEVRAHVLPFAYGSGGNGKGVFLEALIAILGTYAGSAPNGFLMGTGQAKHETELADLQGRRFVICTEVNPTDRFDEAKVKALTGGDTVKARFMRQDFFQFRPTHHLWLMGNDQPAVESGGKSFWRRLRLIPFTHEVPEEAKIEDLQGILARDHGPAILAWAVDGAKRYLADGLREPEAVKAATETYAENTDTIGRFIDDECVINPSLVSSVTAIRAAYEDWCRANGERPITGRRFAGQLAKHGVQVGRGAPKGTAGVRMYGGIGLAARAEDGQEEVVDRTEPLQEAVAWPGR